MFAHDTLGGLFSSGFTRHRSQSSRTVSDGYTCADRRRRDRSSMGQPMKTGGPAARAREISKRSEPISRCDARDALEKFGEKVARAHLHDQRLSDGFVMALAGPQIAALRAFRRSFSALFVPFQHLQRARTGRER